MKRILFEDDALEQFNQWEKQNKKLFDKIKEEFPTVEVCWVEIVRLRKAAAKK